MPAILITGNDGTNTLQGGSDDEVIYGFDPNGPQAEVTSITATRVTAGHTHPIFVGAPPDDLGRLFIVQKTGQIKILDLATGQLQPFLDVSTEISALGERGLLGLAFHPDYADNGFFYVNLINTSGDTEIRRYQVSATNPNRADPASASTLITIDQPDFVNHKAGWLGFGEDGFLYAALGDGGSAGDPFDNAQNIESLLGKILRLDVNADGFPADAARNYAIPADNPFVGVAGADEIWALGLRNPWRASFDRALGDFYIGDVGQARWEEINIGAAGANYGWARYEGPEVFSPGTPSAGTLTFPIHAYDHTVGRSVTGGYVYRGESDGLHGDYFFADYVLAKIFTLRFDGIAWQATERTAQIVPNIGAISQPDSFGEDGRGNLYVVDIDGEIFRLTPNVAPTDVGDVLDGGGGDDLIFGGAGNDTLRGGLGSDTLVGGVGNDFLNGGPGADILSGGDGNDSMIGGADDDAMSGGAGNNYLVGLAGNDTLDGRTGGAGTLQGGTGDDTYQVGNYLDSLIELAGEGIDEVQTALAFYQLREHLEDLRYIGIGNFQGRGNGLDNVIRGGNGNDGLIGFAGNDTLIGGGGRNTLVALAGNDTLDGRTGVASTLQGGAGDDMYIVDTHADSLIEFADEGQDSVQTALASYTLRQNLEDLTYTGAGSFVGRGNELVNVIRGGPGTDLLDGAGGGDQLSGLAGDDVLAYDAQDTRVDGGGDFDTLRFTGSGEILDLTLAADSRLFDIEAVDLTGTGSNSVTLTLAGVLAASSTSDALRVDGNGGDAVLAGDAPLWARGPDETIGANVYRSYTQASATLLIDSDLTHNLIP